MQRQQLGSARKEIMSAKSERDDEAIPALTTTTMLPPVPQQTCKTQVVKGEVPPRHHSATVSATGYARRSCMLMPETSWLCG
jgi:hypothetical protein